MDIGISAYWNHTTPSHVEWLAERLSHFFQYEESLPVEFAPGVHLASTIEKLYGASTYPHQSELQKMFATVLPNIRMHLGEAKIRQLLRKEWMVSGKHIYFASGEPSLEIMQMAIQEWILQQRSV